MDKVDEKVLLSRLFDYYLSSQDFQILFIKYGLGMNTDNNKSQGIGEDQDTGRSYQSDQLVFYDQFCFDLLTLFGMKLLTFNHSSFEQTLRGLFLSVTTNYQGEIRLKQKSQINVENIWNRNMSMIIQDLKLQKPIPKLGLNDNKTMIIMEETQYSKSQIQFKKLPKHTDSSPHLISNSISQSSLAFRTKIGFNGYEQNNLDQSLSNNDQTSNHSAKNQVSNKRGTSQNQTVQDLQSKRPYSYMKGKRESLSQMLKQNEDQVRSKQVLYSKNPYSHL
ncbi:UNKNOWN [Stylonychia lemnae]|uniref:Uncharacterized protein n=1 Tax=Stylonychia lemnae TaxID=5949 RepID=A0A077ZRZ7_STYLE|nr:UNKNOWN [Stylonychia lemnae]|eukprot:CDW72657.1 UNKNOWN [Stylonychia lemnae]